MYRLPLKKFAIKVALGHLNKIQHIWKDTNLIKIIYNA